MSIVEFLRARLDEDEAVARAAIDRARPGTHWIWEQVEDEHGSPMWLRTIEEFPTASGVGDLPGFPLGYDFQVDDDYTAMPHIARHDPARVLREVEAKRRIVDRAEEAGCEVDRQCATGVHSAAAREATAVWVPIQNAVVDLASVYADHPDYDPEWSQGTPTG